MCVVCDDSPPTQTIPQQRRQSSRRREADVRASIAQLQGERALLEKRLRRQSQTVEELQQAAAAAAAAGALLQHVQEQAQAAPSVTSCPVIKAAPHRRAGTA